MTSVWTSKSFTSALGLFSVGGRGKSSLSLSVMEVWRVARLSGENFPTIICLSCSDFWRAYNCLPEETHRLVGKESGQTNHIERLNNTLRQRISRLVRKTLSFSKREYMLNLHFKWFDFFYKQNIVSTRF